MKKFLLTLLVFVMLTPGLACAQIMPHMKAKASSTQETPCHKAGQKQSPDVKLFKDCAKIDLQQSDDGAPLKKPVLSGHDFSFAWADAAVQPVSMLSEDVPVRGPPDRTDVLRSYPPVFLTTQRLRI